ncbi:MAG: hypothetical protein V4661_00135 [Pseudomonadota bacterium]
MTTFLFMLTPETERVLVERVRHELKEQFPEYEFVAGGADIPEFENSILAIDGRASSIDEPEIAQTPNEVDVQRVKKAFATILHDARDWSLC